MCADDDHLVAQFRVAALKDRQDVAEVGDEGLEEPAVVARPVEVDPGELLGQIIGGRTATARARLTTLQGMVGQSAHVPAEVLVGDRLEGCQIRRAFLSRPP